MSERRTGRLKYLARSILGGAARYRRPYHDSVLLLSMRRSGSTLAMQMIASQPGFDYSDQPLDLWRYHPHRRRLPPVPATGRYVDPAPEERAALVGYLRDLLEGRLRVYGQWRIHDPDFHWRVDRVVVKTVNALPLTASLVDGLPAARVIHLVRHPIPTALSIERRGWKSLVDVLLASDGFVDRYVPDGAVTELRRIADRGSPLQRYVLEWGLENLAPLREMEGGRLSGVTYEELVDRPLESSRRLAEALDLPDPERMARTLGEPSRTAVGPSRVRVRDSGGAALVERWAERVPPAEAEEAMAPIRELLGITLYRADDPWPEAYTNGRNP